LKRSDQARGYFLLFAAQETRVIGSTFDFHKTNKTKLFKKIKPHFKQFYNKFVKLNLNTYKTATDFSFIAQQLIETLRRAEPILCYVWKGIIPSRRKKVFGVFHSPK
jgi:hypothetical protein